MFTYHTDVRHFHRFIHILLFTIISMVIIFNIRFAMICLYYIWQCFWLKFYNGHLWHIIFLMFSDSQEKILNRVVDWLNIRTCEFLIKEDDFIDLHTGIVLVPICVASFYNNSTISRWKRFFKLSCVICMLCSIDVDLNSLSFIWSNIVQDNVDPVSLELVILNETPFCHRDNEPKTQY